MDAPPPSSPHVLAFPYPIHGHIFPMLHLCKLLASRGVAITFVNAERNHCTVLSALQQQQLHLDIRLVSIPDGLPRDFKMVDFPTFRQSLRSRESMRESFELLVEKLTGEASTAFSCLLSDVHLGWTQDIADKFGLRRVALWTSNASELAVYFHAPLLMSTGCLPFRADDGPSTQSQRSRTCEIPGLPLLHRLDFPSLLQITDSSDILFRYFIDQTQRIPEADCVLVNSFYDLESKVFDKLTEQTPNLLPVGPLAFFTERDCIGFHTDTDLSAEEDRCLQWLDKQKTSSVLYVSFGSMATLQETQILEFALGLERSQFPFLWVLRPDIVKGTRYTLPKDYLDRVNDRALVVSWAPQIRVLSHLSVGGFLTHCGWNSTMESIYMAVPMLCWPVGADQTLTCKLIVDEWGLGLRIHKSDNSLAIAEEVERKVKILMAAGKGRELRNRVAQQSEALKRAVGLGGSSYQNFQYFIQKSIF